MARKTHHIRTVADYNAIVGAPDEHPHISVVHYDELDTMRDTVNRFEVYGLFLREDNLSNLVYGMSHYDYDEGTLICVGPGQTGGDDEQGQGAHIRGWALLFSPDFIRGTYIEDQINDFHFFSYSNNEALLMNEDEKLAIVDCLKKIREEMRGDHDEAQRSILLALLELVLQYCRRFYLRQFHTMQPQGGNLLARFERLLRQYYDDGLQNELGVPTVKYCAKELCLSPNYFGDLISETTGKTASQTIRDFMMERAKSMLMSGMSASETAYSLGFNYPQHFTRAFKQQFGILPSEYIK